MDAYSVKMRRVTIHLWTFMASKMIGSFGSQVYSFAISLYILKLTGSATNFAANLLCAILPRILAGPFAGYVADAYSRKKVIVTAQLGTSVVILSLLAVSLTVGLSLPVIYATTVLLSLASTFSSIAFTSSITGLVDENRVQKAMSLNQMAVSVSSIGSPAVGGMLYGIMPMPVFLSLYACASVLAVLLESTMNFNLFAKRSVKEEGESKEKLLSSMKMGIVYVRMQPLVRTVIGVALLVNFLMGAITIGYSFILIEKLKFPAFDFGMIEGSMALGTFVTSAYLSVRRPFENPLRISKWGMTGLGVQMMLIAIPLLVIFSDKSMFGFYTGLALLSGALTPLINTPLQVSMMELIDDDYKGRVFAILETMAMALMPLGVALFGFLYDLLPAYWILGGSGLLLILGVFVLLNKKKIRSNLRA